MLTCLSRVCPGTHPHQQLTDGRAKHAAYYPLALLHAILEGMIATRDSERCANDAAENEWDCNLTMAIAAITDPCHKPADGSAATPALADSSIPKTDGGTVSIQYEASNFRNEYVDEYTRLPLPTDLVRAAICEELNYFNKHVWEVAQPKEVMGGCREQHHQNPLG